MQPKDENIETLRGLAILLVVIGHAIGGSREYGLKISDDSYYHFAYFSLQYLRLPLFTTISGFVYALKPVRQGELYKFIVGKGRRILVPFFCVGTLQFIIASIVPYVHHPTSLSSLWLIYFYPYAQFWFLQALMLMLIAIGCVENRIPLHSFFLWALCFVAVLLANSFPLNVELFSFTKFLYLFPFFLLGIGLKRFAPIFFQRRLIFPLFLIFLLSFTFQQLTWFKVVDFQYFISWRLNLIEGFSGMICLFYIKGQLKLKWLAYIGNFAYSIFLFHTFFTSGSRIILQQMGIADHFSLFSISVLLGILLPILAEKLLSKNSYARFFFLGQKFGWQRETDAARHSMPNVLQNF
ncbi:acyltransferase family protein [Candidatus Protochlamydia phocaeensis]|uniref:acyltransferase family protein n=1 Tax=Candidatus Protochlamydia phocaeensis TaxID=1414722 RepID=UPI0008387505|nr:acyltransferase [Candidatus Protochlamydia phocaeensis]